MEPIIDGDEAGSLFPKIQYLLFTLRFSNPKSLRFEDQIEIFSSSFRAVTFGKTLSPAYYFRSALRNDLPRWFGVSDLSTMLKTGFIPWFLLCSPGLPDGFLCELNGQWILFRWMGQGIGLHAGADKNSLLSAGEDEGPVLGHSNPTSKALCPGLPRMSWESTPYLDNLHVDIIIITVL